MSFSKILSSCSAFLLSAFLLLLCPSTSSAREAHITLLFTNDHDGQIDPLPDLSKPVGGVTRRMALIEKIRKEVGPDHVVLVDAGDLLVGTPFSELTRGEVDCAAYQLMKYDAIAIGEHDFDYGQKALPELRRKFRTPWVSANLVRGGQPYLRPYQLKLAGGLRVGLIGFSNPDSPQLVGREKLRGLVFNPPVAAAKGLHSIFKKDADIFVVLSRLGVEGDKKLAKEAGFLHVIVGGFNETVLPEPIVVKAKDGSPIIVQAGSRGQYLGRLDLTIEGHRDLKTKNAEYAVTDQRYQLIPVNFDMPEDPQMVALVSQYKQRFKVQSLDESLATVTGDGFLSSQGDSWLGTMLADSMKQSSGAQVALIQSGAFKPTFKNGNLTREALYSIYPADEAVVKLDVQGSVLKRVLEASDNLRGKDGFLQVSGLSLKKDGGQLRVMVGGEPLKDKQKYLVAVNDHLAGGGDGYDWFAKIKSRNKTQIMLRDLLEQGLRSKGNIAANQFDKRWDAQ